MIEPDKSAYRNVVFGTDFQFPIIPFIGLNFRGALIFPFPVIRLTTVLGLVVLQQLFIVALIGVILYFLVLYYQMIAEVKAHAPETRVILLALFGLFPVLSAHKRVVPQSHKRLRALLCLPVIFVLFILANGGFR